MGLPNEPVSRDQIFWRERGQENSQFPCSADHEQEQTTSGIGHRVK